MFRGLGKKPIEYRLKPKDDLTTEESLLLSLFFQSVHWTWDYGLIVGKREYEKLDEDLKRHFVQV
jgi:hypothetical protein